MTEETMPETTAVAVVVPPDTPPPGRPHAGLISDVESRDVHARAVSPA